jgi:hypothetical protein
MTGGMADEKTPKTEAGKAVPPAGESTAAETRTWDPRLFPGGSPRAAKTHIGVNAIDPDAMWIDGAIVGGVKSTS